MASRLVCAKGLQCPPLPARKLAGSYKLQVLRIRSRALACLGLCSTVRKLEKQERVLIGPESSIVRTQTRSTTR
jgi:hypothetical protein